MPSAYDIIVVGAGPAGSIAAKTAAEQGAAVLLLEKDREIGSPVRCAEGISGRSLRQFVEPDPRWIAAEIKGARLVAPDGNYVDIGEQELGYVLERRLFDRHLAQLAAEAGAEVRVRTEVTGLRHDQHGAVNGVVVQEDHTSTTIPAKVVIGCDGVESRIGIWAGLKTVVKLKDMESCYQYWVTGISFDERLCYFYVGSNYAPGGYAWLFPKGKGLANIGLGISGKRDERKSAKQYLDDFLRAHYPQSRILGATCGGVPVCLFLDKMVSAGLLLAGDAAHTVNPMTGGGIASAMFSGREAGLVAAEAISEGDFSAKRLAVYHSRWEKVQGKKLRHYHHLAQAVEKLDDEALNRTCGLLRHMERERITLGEVFKTALLHEPKLLFDISLIFFQNAINQDYQ